MANSILGINVSAAKIAIVMATVVSTPNKMLGMKFDRVKIENPKHTTKVV